MLDTDYSRKYTEIASNTRFDIELPHQWQDFFVERGEVPTFEDDQRQAMRIKVRAHSLMWFENKMRCFQRESLVVGVYTRDFSRNGIGFLTPMELYPSEVVRILLPTFWAQLKVARVRRLTSKCYEIGAELLMRNDPDMRAYDLHEADTAICNA